LGYYLPSLTTNRDEKGNFLSRAWDQTMKREEGEKERNRKPEDIERFWD